MATEILVNDGGAPARIIPFVAAAAISAGEALKVDTAGKVALATHGTAPIVGIALTDAASGALCNVVTGRGVVVRIMCKDENAGVPMMVDTSGTAGCLDADGGGNTDIAVAITLENNGGDDELTKCLLL